MEQSQFGTARFHSERRINAEDVHLALRARILPAASPLGPLCAMSDGGFSTNSRYGKRSCQAYRPDIDTRRAVPPLLIPLRLKRLPTHVIERVRRAGGPAEVKRTWGKGYKALVAELCHKEG